MSQQRVIAKGLLDELRQALHDIFEWVNYYKTRRINAPFTADANVNRLCFAIEKILSHGLKEGLFSRKTIWDYMSHLEECLPGTHVAQLIDEIKTVGQSSEGRARIFVRYALNNNCLAEYIQSLVWHPEVTGSHYQDYALLRNEDERNLFISLLESISPVNFSLKLKDPLLNQEKYWLTQPMIPTRPPVILPDEEEVSSPGRESAQSAEQPESPSEISDQPPRVEEEQPSIEFNHVPALLTSDSSISSRDRELLYELYKEIAALIDEHAVNPLPIYTQRGVSMIQQLEVIARQGLTGAASQLWDWMALVELNWPRGREYIARVRALIEAVNFSDEPEHVTEVTGDTTGPVTIRSKLGYFRAALFEAANQQVLDELFRALMTIPHEQMSQFFSVNALVTQSRAAEILLVLLRAIKSLTFKLRLEQQRLDLEDYYQRVRDEALVEVNLFGQDKRAGKRRRPVKRVVALDTDSPNGRVIEERPARRPARDLAHSPGRDQPAPDEHSDEHVTSEEQRNNSVNNDSQVTDSNHVPAVIDHSIDDTHSDAASSVGDTDSTTADMLLNIDSMMREHDQLLQQVEQALVDRQWDNESRDELNTSELGGTLTSTDAPLAANSQLLQSTDDTTEVSESVDEELAAQILNPSAELTRMLTHPVPLASPQPVREIKSNLGYILQSRVVDDYQPKIGYLFIAEDDSHDVMRKTAAEDEKELFDERVITRQLSERDYNSMPMFISIDEKSFILDQPVKSPLTASSRCAGCGRQLSSGFFKTVRYCHYTGGHYCSECHSKKRAIIPARVVHHWDFREYSVCTAAKQHIDSHFDDPIINVGVNNPQLYDWVTALNQLRKLRRQMIPLSEYVLRCKHCAPVVISLQSRLHLLQQLHVYSLKDLMEVRTGVLLPFMYKLMEQFIVHVTRQCPLCRGQGHICDICNNRKEVLFPFQLDKIALCVACKSVYHRHCYALVSGNCPKCQRKASLKAVKSVTNSADSSLALTPVNHTQ